MAVEPARFVWPPELVEQVHRAPLLLVAQQCEVSSRHLLVAVHASA